MSRGPDADAALPAQQQARVEEMRTLQSEFGSHMTRRRHGSKAAPSRIPPPAKVVRRPFGTPATKPVPTPFVQETTLAAVPEDSAPLVSAKVEDVASDSMRVAAAADAQVSAADLFDLFTV